MAMSFTISAGSTNTILIQSNDKNVASSTLSQCAEIISKRLKDFSAEKFEVSVMTEKNQIKVSLSNDWDVKVAEKLLIQKGKIGFYKMYTRKNLSELLIDCNNLFSSLNNKVTSDTVVEIGNFTASEAAKVDSLLSLKKKLPCKFVWRQQSDSNDICLYALQLEKNKGSLLSGADIESVKSGKDGKYNFVELSFKKPAIELWANITRQNINHSIAIVMDDAVLCTPVVRSAIENGKAMITGNFTEAETKLIAALGNNGELPLCFSILR